MAKNFYSQFHYGEFLHDTDILTAAATGGWIRILCHMWTQNKHTITLSWTQLAQVMRMTENEAKKVYVELEEEKIFDALAVTANGKITLTCRRLEREEKDKENNRKRQAKFKEKSRITEN